MKKLKSKVGRNRLKIPSVKICLCIPGDIYEAIQNEAVEKSKITMMDIKETSVIYSVLKNHFFGEN